MLQPTGICTSDLISNTHISLSQSTSPRALHFSNFCVLGGGDLLQYELGSNRRPRLRRPVYAFRFRGKGVLLESKGQLDRNRRCYFID